jgi:hypothetical protein
LEVANSWALYLNDIEDLNTVVVESSTLAAADPVADNSSEETVPTDTATAAVEDVREQSDQSQYRPTLLGEGVAVLVDYQQDPAIGRNLALEGNVGLAVYLQQPYLLVMHTNDSSAAAAKLQQLVDSGLTSFLVDGQQVIRLIDTIR